MFEKKHKRIISVICILLSLSSIALTFSGCDTNSNEEVLATLGWNRDCIVVNGYEYVLVINDNWVRNKEDDGISFILINNGTWKWDDTSGKMNVIGEVRVINYFILSNNFDLYASSEEPPVYLRVRAGIPEVFYMLKGHTLPSKYTSSFSSIDFNSSIEKLYFDKAVTMEDIISYENAIADEKFERVHFVSAKLFCSENDILYLNVDIFVINEEFYIRLDDVYYPIVMPEILDSLNTKK